MGPDPCSLSIQTLNLYLPACKLYGILIKSRFLSGKYQFPPFDPQGRGFILIKRFLLSLPLQGRFSLKP